MLQNPEEWELTDADVEEVRQGIADRTAELEKLGVAVAKTDSKEDDQAVTQALQAAKPEIEQSKTSNNGKPDMAALDAAIINALQNAQSDAKAANDQLDISDIEIVDDESGDGDATEDGESDESLISSLKDSLSSATNSVTSTVSQLASEEGREQVATELVNMAKDPDVLATAGDLSGYAAIIASLAGVGPLASTLKAGSYTAKVGEINQLLGQNKSPEAKQALVELGIEAGIDLIPWGAVFNKVPGSKNVVSKISSEAMKIPAVKNALAKVSGKVTAETVETIAKAVTVELTKMVASGDSEEPEASEEGTQAAVEAIETKVPENVEGIQPADVEEAEEELKPEIEADPEKQANAEELKTKVGKKKMAKEKDAQYEKLKNKWLAAKKALRGSNMADPSVEDIQNLLASELNRRFEIYNNASKWEDLVELGHDVPVDQDFGEWKTQNIESIRKYLVTDAAARIGKIDNIEDAESELDSGFEETVKIEDSINNIADNDTSGGDVGGADVQGQTDLETIAKILPELKGKFPNLFKFQGFVKNLAQALMGGSSDASDADGDGVDADGNAQSSGINATSNIEDDTKSGDVGSVEESLSGIYLTEETDVTDTGVNDQPSDTTGQPLDVADAATLKAELDELRKILEPKKINVEELLPQDLKDALAKAPETDVEGEPKTAEQAAEDGKQAGVSDAQKEQAEAVEIYAALIQPMDNFFSTEQAERLGFMEQFLLESQSKMLWNLIGDLTLIAEKGKAKAFTKRKEKEEAGVSDKPAPAPEAEVEQTAEPEVQAEAIGDFFKRDKEPVEISKEDQISLKTDLKALLQTLRATKSMIKSYEDNMTKVSVDPGLDGSALKEQLDQYLPMVQKSIAKIVERANEAFIKATELNAPKEEPEVSQPADDSSPTSEPSTTQESMINAIYEAMQPVFEDMSLMEEDSRDETINFVDGIYNEMRAIYAPVGGGEDSTGLRGFMETGDRARSIQQAEKMLELATKEDFIKLFPGGRIGEGGMPATVNAATETMNREIKKLVLIMRDVVTLASKSAIPHSKLVEIVNSLTTISKSLYNSFGAKMMISGESLAQIETRLGEDEGNKSLTSQETKPGMMDKLGGLAAKAGELGGKALDKLKQMFSWMSDEMAELFSKFFGEEVTTLVKIENSDLSPEQQEAMLKELAESLKWYETLDDENRKSIDALVKHLINRIGRDTLKQLNYPAVVSESITDDERSQIGKFTNSAEQTFGKKLSTEITKFLHRAEENTKGLLIKLMLNDQDSFITYLTSMFKVKEKIGEEAATDLVASSQKNASNDPVSADVESEDDDETTDSKVEPETSKPIDWYNSLETNEQESAITFATNFLNLLRNSEKIPYLIKEGYEPFFNNLKGKYGDDTIGKEISTALNSMKGKSKSIIMNLMEKQPEQFSQFVYKLTTSDDLGKAIFGDIPDQPKPKSPSKTDLQKNKKKELLDYIEKTTGISWMLNAHYLRDSFVNDKSVLKGYKGMERKSKTLNPAQKKCLIMWVMELDKRLQQEQSVKEQKTHPSDSFAMEFKSQLKNVDIKSSMTTEELFRHVRDSLSKASNNSSEDSFWLNQMKDNKKETAAMLATLVHVHRRRDGYDGLYTMVYQKFPENTSEADIIKMYNDVVDYGERLPTDEDYEARKSAEKEDPSDFTLQEALKPIIEKMLNEHYNH